jgi:hypothetical protein
MTTGWQFTGLPKFRDPEPEESVAGLLLHLTERNGYPSSDIILSVLDVRRADLIVAKPDDLARLGAAIHCDPDKLARDSIRVVKTSFENGRTTRDLSLRGVRVSNRLHSIFARRVCPVCVAEDYRHRFWWELTPIGTCPRHGCELVGNCGCGKKLSWRDAGIYRCTECGNTHVSALPHRPAAESHMAKDAYLLSRFAAAEAPRVPVLDSLPVYEAVATMERVGAAAKGFHKDWQNAKKLGIDERILQETGFAILLNGGLGEVLDRLWHEYKAKGVGKHDGFTTAYGWFYHWFNCKGGRNYSPILADAFLAHGAERFSLNSNIRLGDLPADRKRMLSLKEAADYCENSVFAMRNIGLALGLTRGEKRSGAQHSFSAEDVERIARDLKGACTLQEMSRELGVAHKGAHQLMDANIIAPAICGGKQHKHVYVFRRDDIEALMVRLTGDATTVSTPSHSLISLARARGSYAASTADVLQAILANRVRVRERDTNRRGLQALLVDPQELASALATITDDPMISVPLASRITRLNFRGTVRAARLGLLVASRRGKKIMITKESVETFRRDFLMLVELVANGIELDPRISKCRHVGYPRAEVEKLLARPRSMDSIGIREETAKSILIRAVREILQKSAQPVSSTDMLDKLRKANVKLGPSDDKQFFYASLWETREEFVHIPSVGWWLRSRSYEPARYTAQSEPEDYFSRIAGVMVEMLTNADHPMTQAEVVAEVRRAGMRLTATDPGAFIRKVVARNRNRIAKLTGLGYWLRSRPYPPAKYDPETCASGTQKKWERIGSFVVDHLERTKRPSQHDELLKMLAASGIVVKSRNARDYINDALTRNADRIVYLRDHGYWLRHTPFLPAGYSPKSAGRRAAAS